MFEWTLALRDLERFRTVGGLRDVVARTGECRGHEPPDGLFVVYNEYPHGFLP
jgi:hypothetical protein